MSKESINLSAILKQLAEIVLENRKLLQTILKKVKSHEKNFKIIHKLNEKPKKGKTNTNKSNWLYFLDEVREHLPTWESKYPKFVEIDKDGKKIVLFKFASEIWKTFSEEQKKSFSSTTPTEKKDFVKEKKRHYNTSDIISTSRPSTRRKRKSKSKSEEEDDTKEFDISKLENYSSK